MRNSISISLNCHCGWREGPMEKYTTSCRKISVLLSDVRKLRNCATNLTLQK